MSDSRKVFDFGRFIDDGKFRIDKALRRALGEGPDLDAAVETLVNCGLGEGPNLDAAIETFKEESEAFDASKLGFVNGICYQIDLANLESIEIDLGRLGVDPNSEEFLDVEVGAESEASDHVLYLSEKSAKLIGWREGLPRRFRVKKTRDGRRLPGGLKVQIHPFMPNDKALIWDERQGEELRRQWERDALKVSFAFDDEESTVERTARNAFYFLRFR